MSEKIDPNMFADIDTADTSDELSRQQETLHPKTQMVLDKQLEIIRTGEEFLKNFRQLMVEANTVCAALKKELEKAHSVEVKLCTEDQTALNTKVQELVSSVTTATGTCSSTVTTISEETKQNFNTVYEGIGKKMKDDVNAYMKKRVGDTINEIDTHCSAMEDKVKGHFMSNTTYFLHYFLFVVSCVFGFWGAWHFVPYYMTEAMGWTLVAIAGIAAYGLLIYKLRDM